LFPVIIKHQILKHKQSDWLVIWKTISTNNIMSQQWRNYSKTEQKKDAGAIKILTEMFILWN
jgi:hypothetical protein